MINKKKKITFCFVLIFGKVSLRFSKGQNQNFLKKMDHCLADHMALWLNVVCYILIDHMALWWNATCYILIDHKALWWNVSSYILIDHMALWWNVTCYILIDHMGPLTDCYMLHTNCSYDACS